MHCCVLQDASALKVAKQFTISGLVAYKLDNYIINFWILRYLSQINWLINSETWLLSFLKKFVVATKHFQCFIYKTCFAKTKRSILENVTQITGMPSSIFFFFFVKSTFLCSLSLFSFLTNKLGFINNLMMWIFESLIIIFCHQNFHVTVEFWKCSNDFFYE